MTSTRKRHDENNLKILRELGAAPQNKFCFDCGQRGPTYVNVTIGSFVCTKCSGILRGLTPPHRVKSISMATFSADEINAMRTKGNDYCRKLWLGLYENSKSISNSMCNGDEQEIRDFMINKYEHKRYYLEEGAVKAEQLNKTQSSSSSSSSVTPMSNGNNTKITNGIKNGLSRSNKVIKGVKSNGMVTYRSRPEPKNSNSNNFANFEQADIFSNTSSPTILATQTQNGFADFEHNSVYNASSNNNNNNSNNNAISKATSPSTAVDDFSIFDLQFTNNGPTLNHVPLFPRCNSNRWSMPTSSTLNAWATQKTPMNPQNGGPIGNSTPLVNSTPPPPVEDKYAALKDLDNEMKQQQQQHQELWSSSNTGSTGSLYSSSTPTTSSVYGSPSPQSSIFGSPSQGQFMSAFTAAFQENNPQMANPFNSSNAAAAAAAASINPWAACNNSNNHNSSNGISNNNNNSNLNGFANGLNATTSSTANQSTVAFVNPFKEQTKMNGFSNHILQQSTFPTNGGTWGAGNPFKMGSISMNSNNPFL